MDCITIQEASAKWGISPRRIQVLCIGGRIAGAVRFGSRSWAIPANAEKPKDARVKSGRYIKAKEKE